MTFKGKEKSWALFVLRSKVDLSIEFVDNQFRDHKSQAYAASVDFLLVVLIRDEHVEELFMMLLFYADSSVFHWKS